MEYRFSPGNGERAAFRFEFRAHRTAALGNQTNTVKTIVDRFLQAVFFNQNDHLSTNKQSTRSQTEFYLKA